MAHRVDRKGKVYPCPVCQIERLRKAHLDVREQVFETQIAGLSYRTNAEGMCSQILQITAAALGSVSQQSEESPE